MAVKLHLHATSRFTRKVKAADTTGVDGHRTGHFVIQYAYCCPKSDLKYPNYVLLTVNLDEERNGESYIMYPPPAIYANPYPLARPQIPVEILDRTKRKTLLTP
jgi:hypothetical protein